MTAEGPRWLYLHGFASGPESTKGVALARHYAALGVHLQRLDLRVPSVEHLRLSEMIEVTRRAIGGREDRAVLFGSSLGGLTAARLAESDARVCALVLLAPGFRVADQFRRGLGADGERRWRETGWLETPDYAIGGKARVDHGFLLDAEEVDARNGGWADVRVPTLLVHGVRDETCHVALSREWARGKRHVRLVEVDDDHELARSIPVIARESQTFLAPFLGALPGS